VGRVKNAGKYLELILHSANMSKQSQIILFLLLRYVFSVETMVIESLCIW
jgi:hypothetical protein